MIPVSDGKGGYMSVNQNVFIHETDRSAMEALKAIPGFSQVTRAFMNSWNEKIMHIENMAANIRISEEQLPHIHAMLEPICKKLDIEVPDLFLKLDVIPNAYTYGDTKPFIVITSGLLNTIPEDLLPVVLAHECGHIACHHVLYRTMGRWILSGTVTMIPLSIVAIYPVMAAFHRWMRCSELSADRAAALCTSGEQVIEMCMRFAGFDRNIPYAMNTEAFMAQAEEYRKMIAENKMNKTMEFMRFSNSTHPINAVRACECRDWMDSEDYKKAKRYFEAVENNGTEYELPVSWTEKSFVSRSADETEKQLKDLGFRNIVRTPVSERGLFVKEGDVLSVSAADEKWISCNTPIAIRYYQPETVQKEVSQSEDIALKHSGFWFSGKKAEEAEKEFRELGFTDIVLEPVADITDEESRNTGRVITVQIGGSQVFRRNDLFPKDAEIRIVYHALAKGGE